MSRSSWKPKFRHPQAIESSNSTGEFVFQNRATVFTQERVGRRVQIYNGFRWVSFMINAEKVGHLAGEFSPTRKRPIPKKKKGGKA